MDFYLSDTDFTSYIVESEMASIISKTLAQLPEESCKVFKLIIEGYSVKDIALKLDKAASTIYTQKHEAITILKKLFVNDK